MSQLCVAVEKGILFETHLMVGVEQKAKGYWSEIA